MWAPREQWLAYLGVEQRITRGAGGVAPLTCVCHGAINAACSSVSHGVKPWAYNPPSVVLLVDGIL